MSPSSGGRGKRRSRISLEERFWSKVDKGDGTGCWLWTASCFWDGYGQIMVRDENDKPVMRRASRVAWELVRGPIPEGSWVLHHCDNPPCVRPEGDDHLFLGTHEENMEDQWNKKRNFFQTHGNPASKLTDEQIENIRQLRSSGELLRTIASRYGVSEGHVCFVSGRLERNGNVGSRHFRAKLTEDDVRTIRRLRSEGWTYPDIGARFGVAYTALSKIARGIAWKHVKNES